MVCIKKIKLVYLFASILIYVCSNTLYATTSTSPLLKPTDKTNAIWCKKLIIDKSKAVSIGNAPGTQLNCKSLGDNWIPIGFANNSLLKNGSFIEDYVKDVLPGFMAGYYPLPKGTKFNDTVNVVQLICAPRVLEFTQGRCTQ